MKISVIVPVLNGGEDLRRCLHALQASDRTADELLVVDDGSTDATPEIAEAAGAIVITVRQGPRGPAFARNLGVSHATGDIVAFVDADVVVKPDALGRIEANFAEEPDLHALFGSYDDSPRGGLVARYKNLLHHYTHQFGRRDAWTFWAGLGAIRREVFLEVNGFDAESYARPCIEDIELGVRLKEAGYRIGLRPDVQGTHLKGWTFVGMIRTDIVHRAVPWTTLLLSKAHLPADLNLSWSSRISAGLTLMVLPLLVASLWAPSLFLVTMAILYTIASLNANLVVLFARRGGIRLALVGFVLHLLYLIYSSVTFVGVSLWESVRHRLPFLNPRY